MKTLAFGLYANTLRQRFSTRVNATQQTDSPRFARIGGSVAPRTNCSGVAGLLFMSAVTNKERFAVTLVQNGTLRINTDGSVTQLKRWGRPCLPRRCDFLNSKQYRVISVRHDGKPYLISVHRLIWQHHFGDIPSTHIIHHNNGIRGDNRLANLALVTVSQNVRFGLLDHGYRAPVGEKHTFAKLTEAKVRAMRDEYREGIPYPSIAKKYGISSGCAWMVVMRRSWKHVT
jgi:hypothetical protein